jgi:hypothetical protein
MDRVATASALHSGSLRLAHFVPAPASALAARDEREGLGDEAWPPNFPKAVGEPTRVAPSRAKKVAKKRG